MYAPEDPVLPSIWKDSPCTLSYVDRAQPFEQSKRFEFNSIYYKDDPFKPKLQPDPFSRPEAILQEFRKRIKEVSKNNTQHYGCGRNSKSPKNRNPFYKDMENQLQKSQINSRADEVSKRLFGAHKKMTLSLDFDANGNRSSFIEDQNDNVKQNRNNSRLSQNKSEAKKSPREFKAEKVMKKDSDNVYITSTPRTDLAKPINFNPGPGSYQCDSKHSKVKQLENSSSKPHSGKVSAQSSHTSSPPPTDQINSPQLSLKKLIRVKEFAQSWKQKTVK